VDHTLSDQYFERAFHEEWTQALEELEAGGLDIHVMDFSPLDPDFYGGNSELFDTCFDHAIATGSGFLPWVYTLFSEIKMSFGADMADKVASVRHGDIVGLLSSVKLAICYYEVHNPDDLDVEFTKCTMAGEGQNDLMRYLSAMATLIRRLEAADHPPRDSKKQRVLLNGLNQEIFENFIIHADCSPYPSYAALVKDLERTASKSHVLAKLRTLRPGTSQSMLVTDCKPTQPSPPEDRLERIERILATFTSAALAAKPVNKKVATGPCHRFAAGKCTYGDKCRFSHDPVLIGQARGYCDFHKREGHSTADCRAAKEAGASVNVTKAVEHHFMFMTKTDSVTITDRDQWIVDGASTSFATWDPSICTNIRPCNVKVSGSDKNTFFMCTRIGDCLIPVYNSVDKTTRTIFTTNVLIHQNFPTHILSEIMIFAKGCTATKSRDLWEFKKPDGSWLLDASQHVVGSKLYYVNTAPPAAANTSAQLQVEADEAAVMITKVSTAKNLQLLVELHCAHSHHNFKDLAAQHGLCFPDPAPTCWACMLAKPRQISHDAISSREVSRVFEGFAVDWKGPFTVHTPEGFVGFFLILDLLSGRSWIILSTASSEWPTIWTKFVLRIEAKTGKQNSIAYMISDGGKVFDQQSMKDFNDSKGVEIITTAPFQQWQNPAERCIQTVVRGAVADMIHGGGTSLGVGSCSVSLIRQSEPGATQ
jgi:hypothetical protein